MIVSSNQLALPIQKDQSQSFSFFAEADFVRALLRQGSEADRQTRRKEYIERVLLKKVCLA